MTLSCSSSKESDEIIINCPSLKSKVSWTLKRKKTTFQSGENCLSTSIACVVIIICCEIFIQNGSSGIRTPDSHDMSTRFPSVRIRPLCQASTVFLELTYQVPFLQITKDNCKRTRRQLSLLETFSLHSLSSFLYVINVKQDNFFCQRKIKSLKDAHLLSTY